MKPTLSIDETKKYLTIKWDEQHESKRHVTWLRLSCCCMRCAPPPSSASSPLEKGKFQEEFLITSYEIRDSNLHIKIDKEIYENHITIIPISLLKSHCNCETCFRKKLVMSEMKYADPKTTPVPRAHCDSLESVNGKFECLEKVFNVGFCVIEGVPREHLMVQKIAEKFAYVLTTRYGQNYDVKYEPDADNIADTTLPLPYHQDQMIYSAMPSVQLLHAIEFDECVKGGESQIVDLFKAAAMLREESPADFETLCRVPCTFQAKDLSISKPIWYETAKKHIEVDYAGQICSVNWNTVVEGILSVRPEDEAAYYKAYARFARIINREEIAFTFRMKPGDLTLINNKRMAHSRKAFEIGNGKRHMQCCYIDLDDLKSCYLVLAHQLGKKVQPPRCGNSSQQ